MPDQTLITDGKFAAAMLLGCWDLTRSTALLLLLLLVFEVCNTAGGGVVLTDHFVLFADLPSPATMCSVRCAVCNCV